MKPILSLIIILIICLPLFNSFSKEVPNVDVCDTIIYNKDTTMIIVPFLQKRLRKKIYYGEGMCTSYVIDAPPMIDESVKIDDSILQILDFDSGWGANVIKTLHTDNVIIDTILPDRRMVIWKREQLYYRIDIYHHSIRLFGQNFHSLYRLNEVMNRVKVRLKRYNND